MFLLKFLHLFWGFSMAMLNNQMVVGNGWVAGVAGTVITSDYGLLWIIPENSLRKTHFSKFLKVDSWIVTNLPMAWLCVV